MITFTLDRMALDEAGTSPQKIAEAIHLQLGDLSGPVPVKAIALALDIVEIREELLTSFEGALITTLEKGYGSIVVNVQSGPQRRRFTVAHELGHFLNPWHKPTTPMGFQCSRQDMIVSVGQDRHLRQEAEANAFAIELLAPRKRLACHLSPPANLQHALAIASMFDISKESAVRRYVALHDECLAVVISHQNKILYCDRTRAFPRLCLGKGDHLPPLPQCNGNQSLSLVEETEPNDWLTAPGRTALSVQTLYQQKGFGISLLIAETCDDEDPLELEDAFDRFSKFSPKRGA